MSGEPQQGAEPELFNVRAVLTVEGKSHKAINSILLHAENHTEAKYLEADPFNVHMYVQDLFTLFVVADMFKLQKYLQ